MIIEPMTVFGMGFVPSVLAVRDTYVEQFVSAEVSIQ
jgi:hypothetical protein